MSPSVLRPSPDSGEGRKWFAGCRERYEEIVSKSEGFDVCGQPTPIRFRGLSEQKCSRQTPCPVVVRLYAKLGLHRYNFLQGKNLHLFRVKKFNISTHSLPGSYYITLEAKDPCDLDSIYTFQTQVNEAEYYKLSLFCNIARILGEKETNNSNMSGFKMCPCSYFSSVNPSFDITDLLPEVPTENPFKRFYLLKKSEVQDNDWIRLYLELAVATSNRNSIKYYDLLSNLKILKVAIKNNTQDHKGLIINAYDATFYIRYMDKDNVDRIAIVRRVLQEKTFIVGRTLITETIIPKHEERKSKRAQLLFRRLLSVHQPWRKAYKNRSCRHKRKIHFK